MPAAKFLSIAIAEFKLKPSDARSLLQSQQHLEVNSFRYSKIGDLAVSRGHLSIAERDAVLAKQTEYGDKAPTLPDPLEGGAPTGLETTAGRVWLVVNCVIWIGGMIGVGAWSNWDIDLLAALTVFGAAMLVALRDVLNLIALILMGAVAFVFPGHVVAVASVGAVATFVLGLLRDATRASRDPSHSRFSSLRWALVLATLVSVIYSISMASKMHDLVTNIATIQDVDKASLVKNADKYWHRCWSGLATTSLGFVLVFVLARWRQREVWYARQKVETISESVTRIRGAIVEFESKKLDPAARKQLAQQHRLELLQLLGLSIRRNTWDDFISKVPFLNRLVAGATVWYLELDKSTGDRLKICAFASPGAPKSVLDAMGTIRDRHLPVLPKADKWAELLEECTYPGGSKKVDMEALRRRPERSQYASLAGRVFQSPKPQHGASAIQELELNTADLDSIPVGQRTPEVNRWLSYRGGWAGTHISDKVGTPQGALMVFKNSASDMSVEDLLLVRTIASLLGLLD